MSTKYCPKCKSNLLVSEFSRDSSRHDGLQWKCKSCQKKASKAHYTVNKAMYRSSSKHSTEKRRDKIRELKESEPCTDCKVYYPYYVMHYDHLGEADKVQAISQLISRSSWQAILDEIAKCELVCANCHAHRTHSRLVDSSDEAVVV